MITQLFDTLILLLIIAGIAIASFIIVLFAVLSVATLFSYIVYGFRLRKYEKRVKSSLCGYTKSKPEPPTK